MTSVSILEYLRSNKPKIIQMTERIVSERFGDTEIHDAYFETPLQIHDVTINEFEKLTGGGKVFYPAQLCELGFFVFYER